jgi:hypothetical protein
MIGSREARDRAGRRSLRPWQPLRLRRSMRTLALLLPALLLLPAGCSRRPARTEAPRLTLTALDTVLGELGGPLTASLTRQQRWRMISSLGPGLPPENFKMADLPEPNSYGAALLQVYCQQCHWLPSPQMHSAGEWPVLLRRMLLRERTLQNRLGGPATRSLVGSWLLDIVKNVGYPTPEEQTRILEYLQQNALPVARPGEFANSPESRLFTTRCTICHDTPSPSAHTAAEWPAVVARMESNMQLMDVPTIPAPQADSIVHFLQQATRRR